MAANQAVSRADAARLEELLREGVALAQDVQSYQVTVAAEQKAASAVVAQQLDARVLLLQEQQAQLATATAQQQKVLAESKARHAAALAHIAQQKAQDEHDHTTRMQVRAGDGRCADACVAARDRGPPYSSGPTPGPFAASRGRDRRRSLARVCARATHTHVPPRACMAFNSACRTIVYPHQCRMRIQSHLSARPCLLCVCVRRSSSWPAGHASPARVQRHNRSCSTRSLPKKKRLPSLRCSKRRKSCATRLPWRR